MPNGGITIGGTKVRAGEQMTIELPVASLYSHATLNLPVQVLCGKRSGPCLFVSAAIHGDEINGVEIIRRLLRMNLMKKMRGTLLAIPIVNVYGFVHHSRYLPDRRDLNRSFPGSEKGSMAARLADLFMNEIVKKSDFGVDLHTGAIHRDNLPQIRANLDDERTLKLAHAFNVPVLLNSDLRDGSLREAADELGIPIVLYEAGEALRFNEKAIHAGVKGIVSVMRELGMLPRAKRPGPHKPAMVARSSSWIRAGRSGIHRATVALGERVNKGQILGFISDPFGSQELEVKTNCAGIVIGKNNLPLTNEGEALFHIARFESHSEAHSAIEAFQADNHPIDPALASEPPIV